MTLQELKQITEIPEEGRKIPTAKNLRETGRAVAKKQLTNDIWIAAYQNGYALYHAYGHYTVFPIHTCGDYLYVSGGVSSYLSEHFFAKESWHIRLVLEGEDRLERNQRAKEQGRTISYSAISEEWEALEDTCVDLLEDLTVRETMDELLDCLTERQKMAASLCFFQQKSRKEAAKELGITNSAVSIILSQAVRRLRKKYLSKDQTEKVVAVV